MYFKTLSKEIKDAILKLTSDKEFQDRFANDKKLDEIDELKINKGEELKFIQLLLTNKIEIQNHIFKAMTPAIWSFLWIIDSPFVCFDKNITQSDVDIFFYLLENGVGDCDPVRIVTESLQFTSRCIQITFDEAFGIITEIIKLSFKPLNLFPNSNSKGQNIFDADFLTSLVTRVRQVTGYNPDYILNEMSMSSVCYYFAQFARVNGNENIFRRTEEEILIMQDLRASELIVERLIELDVIKPEEKEKYVKIITTPPNKNK